MALVRMREWVGLDQLVMFLIDAQLDAVPPLQGTSSPKEAAQHP